MTSQRPWWRQKSWKNILKFKIELSNSLAKNELWSVSFIFGQHCRCKNWIWTTSASQNISIKHFNTMKFFEKKKQYYFFRRTLTHLVYDEKTTTGREPRTEMWEAAADDTQSHSYATSSQPLFDESMSTRWKRGEGETKKYKSWVHFYAFGGQLVKRPERLFLALNVAVSSSFNFFSLNSNLIFSFGYCLTPVWVFFGLFLISFIPGSAECRLLIEIYTFIRHFQH